MRFRLAPAILGLVLVHAEQSLVVGEGVIEVVGIERGQAVEPFQGDGRLPVVEGGDDPLPEEQRVRRIGPDRLRLSWTNRAFRPLRRCFCKCSIQRTLTSWFRFRWINS